VQENSVNGGSYRISACRADDMKRFVTADRAARFGAFAFSEKGYGEPKTFELFHREIMRNTAYVRAFIKREVADGKKVHVLGSSTKGNVLLQLLGLDSTVIEAASERSPEKIGRYTIGTGIPIVSEEDSRRMEPDWYFVLPYCFKAEIIAREHEFQARGGRFLFALPSLEVV
jgi:hypothetical protein